MARGSTLDEIVTLTRDEAGLGSSAASITDMLPQIKTVVRRTQEMLYEEHDWPFLRVRDAPKAMAAGQRYYDFPAALNPYRIFGVRRKWNQDYLPIERGIEWQQYSELNSDADLRNDPVQRWDWYTDGTSTQFEVWPIPASADCTIHFDGMRSLQAFVNDDAVADLDDYLIALFAATKFMSAEAKKEKQAEAAQRLKTLKANAKGGTRVRTMTGGGGQADRPQGTIIRISG